uniref:UBX domain protein 4 n=1 Tax=Phasianus colchicus TaxID=9054 RepID=A0A669PYP1_PHACC
MMWFGGSIPAAIAAAKQRSSVFVVFVSGEDEQSAEMAARWEDAQVTEAASDGFVAIKIDTKRFDSTLILSFIQFFIDDDGSMRREKSSPCTGGSLNTVFENINEFSTAEATGI